MSAQFEQETENFPEIPEDALELQRQRDIAQVEDFLKSHEILGEFFQIHWGEFSHFVRVEEYHKDVHIIKHEEVSRKVYILLEGDVSAFVLTRKTPKPQIIFEFPPQYILTELNGLLGDPHHFGLIAVSDCKLISFDLDYIEHEEANYQLFREFIDVLYPFTARLTTELCNEVLEQKQGLREMLRKQNFFSNIDHMDEEPLNRLAESMQYIYTPKNEILLDDVNNEYIYLIEAGSVQQTKEFEDLRKSDSYLYTRSLESVYIKNSNEDLQEVFEKHIEIEAELNQQSDFEHAISQSEHNYEYKVAPKSANSSPSTNNDTEKSKVVMTEVINRYGVVGEDYLSNFSNCKINAITKSDACLIKLKIADILPKYSIFEQVTGFFNNKINDMQLKVVNKQNRELNLKNKYIALVNFCFLFMIIMATLGISGRFHGYFNFSSQGALIHHIVIVSLASALLIKFLQPLELSWTDLGLTLNNFKKGLKQAIIATVVIIPLATIIKDFYIMLHAHQFGLGLFQPDLVINENLTQAGFTLFLTLYIGYIFIYELCARGILQNIFSIILSNNYKLQYWGSIFAASAVASQFHMSLFHEFSLTLFLGNIFAGIIFANTRNLWAVFLFHSVFSVYILTVLGLLPGSHY